MYPLYKVPLIPCNLRHEETIVQIADTLNYLNNMFDDIFNRIDKRVEKYNNNVSNIMMRIKATSEKVNKLRGKKKATQIFSSSKYPAADIHGNYKSVFAESEKTTINFVRTDVKCMNPQLLEQSLDKLQLYHVKVNEKSKREMKNMLEGLGAIPENIESIDELFLFNTSKNPYKSYVMSDPLQVIQRIREVSQQTTVVGPDAAPLSISQRSGVQRVVADTYFYSPGLGHVPDIDVPLDLPDLPGVADDLQYLLESGPVIAPSVTTTPVTPELPVVVTQETPETVINQPVKSESQEEKIPLPSLPVTVNMDSKIVHTVEHSVYLTEITKTLDNDPKQMPQLVTQPVPQLVVDDVKKKQQNSKTFNSDQFDVHASLMEAIREVGGVNKANLRVARSKKQEQPKTTVKTSNDLMSDLHAKLVLRRRGISGAKNTETSTLTESGSVMDRISAIIPPPSVNTDHAESTNTEDEDWD